jgi:GNAT superfamily N-acetyltransferase
MDIVIREAAPGDIPAAHRLIESAYRGDAARQGWTHEADMLEGQRTDPEAIAGLIADPKEHLLLAFDGEAAVASVNISHNDATHAYLGLLAVDPARQAGGLGRRMIAAAEDLARGGLGCVFMEMMVIRQREALIAYYERRGYSRTGEDRPFPYADTRFGLPTRPDLVFEVLEKRL